MMRGAFQVSAVLVAALVSGIASGAAHQVVEVEIPQRDGVVELSRVLQSAADVMGLPAPTPPADVTIDLGSPAGRAQLDAIAHATRGAITVTERADCLVLDFDRSRLDATVGRARVSVESWFDEVTASVSRSLSSSVDRTRPVARPWGVTIVTDTDKRMPLDRFTATHEVPERVVILVHGLDDPGWVWGSTVTALRKAGHIVARMTYPNDGPIADSADLFARELRRLRHAGIRQVDIVAHSMGGLVSRDVLTRGEHFGGDGRGCALLPAVDRLIMCGTPNHGSEMARLRAVSELQEQLSRAFTGDGVWLGGIADGTGEAAVDLLPGSDFLRDLNARAHPKHTRYSIIAGRMSPLTISDVATIRTTVRDTANSARAPQWLRNLLRSADRAATGVLDEAVRGIGDGCVTLDSARLDKVADFTVVDANHVTMLASVIPSKEQPPAIPLIVERLAR